MEHIQKNPHPCTQRDKNNYEILFEVTILVNREPMSVDEGVVSE